jgi:iron-sulfur cluster assembly protein
MVMVTLTEKAALKVKEIIRERGGDEQLALRLYVTGGGCSGLSYGLALDQPREDDNVIEVEGVTVLVDPMSARFVKGSEIDYKEALMGGGFAISNPNAIRTCGCGSSFRTADEEGEPELCD